MPERDEHYWKYRVFHEPTPTQDIGHPVPIKASYLDYENKDEEVWANLEEVEGNFFVLRPEGDHHARVAMAAYAYSCRKDFPNLAADILGIINMIEWEEETGQSQGDFPLERDDYLNPNGEGLDDNVVQFLRRRFEETT